MEEIRLLTASEIREYIDIAANAFPMINMNTPEDKEKLCQQVIQSMETGFCGGAYGCFRDGRLIGGIRLFDFPMNMLGRKITLGGLGMVAVHLAFKKEKVASRMIQYYFEHYHAKICLPLCKNRNVIPGFNPRSRFESQGFPLQKKNFPGSLQVRTREF